MNALRFLSACARRVGGLTAAETTDNACRESEHEDTDDEVTQAYRLLRFVKLILVIVATALTIGRLLGWL